ncbi:MAG: DNA-directed RNA polymerase subunit A'' [Halobacteriaceae archaeon]
MTDYNVSDDIETVVEDTELPRRLKNQIYEEITSRDVEVDPESASDIAQAVESRYTDSRVDPLDPVGTISAQSIGEPGTQMSIPGDERILIREQGETKLVPIGDFVDAIITSTNSRQFNDHEVARPEDCISVPSLSANEDIEWKPIEEVSRHNAPDELLRIELDSGRTITATKNHSFVTRSENNIVPITGESLERGDWLPVVGSLEGSQQTASFSVGSTSTTDSIKLTDGGTVKQTRSTDNISSNDSRNQETDISLTPATGYVIGAWIAAGSINNNKISIHDGPVDRLQEIGSQLNDSTSELIESIDQPESESRSLTIESSALVSLLKKTCSEHSRKSIPDFAYNATLPFVEGLLDGFITTGDPTKTEAGTVQISVDNEAFLHELSLLFTRVNIVPDVSTGSDEFILEIHSSKRLNDHLNEGSSPSQPPSPVPSTDGAITTLIDTLPESTTSFTTDRQTPVNRNQLKDLLDEIRDSTDSPPSIYDDLRSAINSDVVWDQISNIETVEVEDGYVYDLSVQGLETFTTAQGIVTHNTMNTFHYAGVAEIDVTQGLPRLIELVDARKTPDTPMMTVHLEDEYATEREKAHEVVWKIEATKILALGDISTNVADMIVQIDLNEDTLQERWPTVDDTETIAEEIAETIESKLGVETDQNGTLIAFGPKQPSYRQLLQLVEELRDIVFKGIEDISRVVIRKEEIEGQEEFVLYTEGSAFGKVLEIEGVDASRTTCNNIHEIRNTLGIEAAREAIIDETMNTLEEQGLDDVNVRHLMLVADIMTNTGNIESIGRHGISGSKNSVLARAAFEVTVSHLLDAAVYGEVDDLNGVTENVIVGKPIKLGTGDVDLRMGASMESSSD